MSSRCPHPIELSRAATAGAMISASLQTHLDTCARCTAELESHRNVADDTRILPAIEPTADHARVLRAAILTAARTSPSTPPRHFWMFGVAAATALAAAAAIFLLVRNPQQPSYRGSIHAHDGAQYVRVAAAPDEIVRLTEGTLTVEVSPLAPKERFRVITGDGEVEVRGTMFDVTASADKLVAVRVMHGKVEVRASGAAAKVLVEGERWDMKLAAIESPPKGSGDVAAPATGDVVAPATGDVVAPAMGDVAVPAMGDVGAGRDATARVARDSTGEAGRDATPGAGRDATARVARDSTGEAGRDATARVAHGSTGEAGRDATARVAHDATGGAGRDATARVAHGSTGEAGRDATARVAHGSTGEAGRDATARVAHGSTGEAGARDATGEAGRDATPGAGRDATARVARDSTGAAGRGATPGASRDATRQTARDATTSNGATKSAGRNSTRDNPTTPAITLDTTRRPATSGASKRPIEVLFDRGWAALAAGKLREAATAFEHAASSAPSDPLAEDAWFWRATALARAKSSDAAAAIEQFLDRYPRSNRAGEASAMLGWLVIATDLDRAETLFTAAAKDRVPAVRASGEKGLAAVAKRRAQR